MGFGMRWWQCVCVVLVRVVSCGVWHEVVAVCVWCLLGWSLVGFGMRWWQCVCVVLVRVVSCGVWHEVVVMCVVLVASGLLWGSA